jgi:hypothetical protein
MHTRELVDLACVLTAHGPVLVRQSGPLAEPGLEEYWVASKCRLDRWSHRLSHPGEKLQPAGTTGPCPLAALVEEVLTGEVLTRVWAAVACAHDRSQRCDDAEPIARSVLIGHLEARHRVLTLLVSASEVQAEEALRLNCLRRRVERWTDMLIGHLSQLDEVREFAFEPERAADFAEDLQDQGRQPGGRHVWSLLQGALQSAFSRDLSPWSPNADLNARIAGGILSCFPAEVFDSTGLPRSLWSLRLTKTATDAQGMIGELLSLDSRPAAALGGRVPRPRRFGG